MMISNEIDYSILPQFREIVPEEDLSHYVGMSEVDEYRWITSLKRVNWHKYFAKQTDVHLLVRLSASCVSTNPIAFLKPEWVNRAIQRYDSNCPELVKGYAAKFHEAVKAGDFQDMKEWFEVIESFV